MQSRRSPTGIPQTAADFRLKLHHAGLSRNPDALHPDALHPEGPMRLVDGRRAKPTSFVRAATCRIFAHREGRTSPVTLSTPTGDGSLLDQGTASLIASYSYVNTPVTAIPRMKSAIRPTMVQKSAGRSGAGGGSL